MRYVRAGTAGLKLTEVSFGSALTIGTENRNPDYAQQLVDKAWEFGIRSFDVSNNYGYGEAERLTSAALKKYPREEYVISTKGSWPIGDTPYHRGLSRKHILWAFETSMERMDLDYVDLYYAHRYDPDTAMEEIVRTFNWLIQQGRVRYWATSEWPVSALEECHAVCDRLGLEKPILEQFLYSFAIQKARTNGVMDFCEAKGVGMMAFSPLCQGLLTGKYRSGVPAQSRISKSAALQYDKTANFYEQNKERIDRFVALCDERGYLGSQVALQWCLKNNVLPVVGASRPEQLDETLQGLTLEPPEDFWDELRRIR
jgi:aryl-alcohol dehydrogenase-like predicted oxidoreductase